LRFRFWRGRSGKGSKPGRPAVEAPITKEQAERILERCRGLRMEILEVAGEVCEKYGFTPERFVAVAYILRSHAFRAFEESWMAAFEIILGKLLEELEEAEEEP